MQFLPASLLNNGGKKNWVWKKNEAEKSKASFKAWRFSSFTGGEKKRTQTFKLFSLPISPSVSLSHSPQQLNPPDTWGQPRCITSSIASPEQHFSHTLFQSIDNIPSALFSPITLCHVAIWTISAVLWLGLREECRGLGRCHRAPYAMERSPKTNTVFNHVHTETKNGSNLTVCGAERLLLNDRQKKRQWLRQRWGGKEADRYKLSWMLKSVAGKGC